MATSNSSSNASMRSVRSSASAEYKTFIEKQLDRTRIRVKIVDLATVLMGLIGFVLAYMLVLVLIDHWVVGLGRGVRLLAWAVLVGSVAYGLAAFLGPLLLRRINPAYAARAIEESDPSLKNSLINYLMFRGDASPVGRAVERMLRKRAALDLKQVNMDTAVDHSKLIYIGYAVVAVVIFFAVYLIFSPKDVFQTVRRVVVPWADIERPSRVQITDVLPGDNTVLFGQSVTVSARVERVRDEETVTLFFSTQDKQIVERPVRMQRQKGTMWTCTLPEDQTGLERDLVYRIEAGDARTRDFSLRVLPVPTILVDRIEYKYPDYTQLQNTIDRKGGDIHALEGTYVTIHARTNRPVQSAWIQFDPESPSASSERTPVTQRMRSKGKESTYAFWLKMDSDHTQPQYATYHLRFTDDQEMRSQNPIVHQISVTRDLPPEVAILTPQDVATEVPEDSHQRIEVRAVDPDFGLSRIVLHAVSGNKSLLQHALFDAGQARTGQVVRNFDFVPRQLGLPVGTEVVFWAVAEDNRVAPRTGTPDPNRQRTREYRMTIVPPKSAGTQGSTQKPPDQQDKTGKDPQDGSPDAKKPDQTGSVSSSQQTDPSDKQGDKQGGQSGDQQGDQQSGKQGDQQDQTGKQSDSASDQQPADKQGSEAGGAEDSQTGQMAGDEGAAQNPNGTTGDQGGQAAGQQSAEPAGQDVASGASGAGAQSSTPRGEQAGGDSQHAGTPDGDSSKSGQGVPKSADQQPAGRLGGGQPKGSAEPGNSGDQSASSEPLHDGDVFEQAMKYFQQADRQQASGNPKGAARQASSTDGASEPNGQDAGSDGAAGQPKGTEMDGGAGQQDNPQQTDSGTAAGEQSGSSPEQTPAGQDSQPRGSQAPGDSTQRPNGPSDPNGSTGKTSQGTGSPQDAGGDNPADGSPGADEHQQRSGEQPMGGGGQMSSPDHSASSAEGTNPQQDGGSKDAAGKSAGAESQPADASRDSASPSQSTDPTTGAETAGTPSGRQQPDQTQSPNGATGAQGSPDTAAASGTPSGSDSASQSTGDAAGQAGTDSSSGAAKATDQSTGQSADQSQASRSESGHADGTGQSAAKGADQGDRPSGHGAATEPGGGGSGQYGSIAGTDSSEDIPEGEAANLQYARKATDLVLRRLQDQQDKPDPQLLKRLGWTADDLRAFVRRWQLLKREAKEEKLGAKDDMEDALKSLGLHPVKPRHVSDSKQDDQRRGLRDAGSRSRPPAEFLEQFNAYRKAAAREHRSGG